jgi:ATP-dependent helicase/nuclease subunit A
MAWTDAPAAAPLPAAQISRLASIPAIDIEERARHRRWTNLPRSRLAGDRILAVPGKSDQGQAAQLRAALAFSGAAQVESISSVFLTDTDRTPRKSVVTKNFARDNRRWALFRSEADPSPLIEAPRCDRPRPHRALLHRDRGGRQLPREKAGARPARL